jgi:diguanylate cyclase (GGDEF)-like protein/PAS domain S-box-containing protein
MADVVVVVDPDGRIRYAAPSLASALGHRPEDALGRSVLEFLRPEDGPLFLLILAEAVARPGRGVPHDLSLRHRDDSWRVFEVLGSRLADSSEGINIVLEARDVTQRRRDEVVLRQSEERFALAMRGANDGVWDWDLAADRIFFSARWKAMLGCDEAEIGDLPNEWLGRVHAEDLERLKTDFDAHIAGKTPRFECEHRVRRKDDSYHWMLARGIALRDTEGKACRIAGSQTDVTARKAAEDLLLHQAIHDALTGLPNRTAFIDRLERSIARAQHRSDYIFAVLFLDVDRFKLVNDSLGHMSGDQLLISLARRLSGILRPGDMVAHIGGDEFAVLADHIAKPDDATQIASRIQRGLQTPFSLAGQEVFATTSIGIAMSTSGYERPEEVLRDADAAMYRAKAQGSGRYELFDKGMHARALARLKLETDLRRAIERNELLLHYQPVVSLSSGKITGFEALARWQHPERGLVGPLEFIPVAEETGLIVPIGAWVVGEACRQARRWQERFPRTPLSVSMNLTSTHFTETEVMRGIEQALQETGLDGHHLMIEITESVMMKEIDSVIAILLALKSLDIELHIDDFGTGYSSLSYLHRLPTDALKIDRSFVSRMGKGKSDIAIVRTIVEMAHNLGRHVIAEGIETPEQLERLRALGCEFGQGYHFSRPLEEQAAEALLISDPKW